MTFPLKCQSLTPVPHLLQQGHIFSNKTTPSPTMLYLLNKATAPNFSQTVLPTWDQVFKYESLGGRVSILYHGCQRIQRSHSHRDVVHRLCVCGTDVLKMNVSFNSYTGFGGKAPYVSFSAFLAPPSPRSQPLPAVLRTRDSVLPNGV